MKRALFFLFACCAAVLHLAAQHGAAPVRRSPGLPEFLQAWHASEAARTGVRQPDSAVTFFGYPEAGQPDSLPMFRTVYQRPSAAQEIQLEDQYVNGWAPMNRTSLRFDGTGRLTEQLSESYQPDSGRYLPDTRAEIFLHGNSEDQLDSIFVYAWGPGGWQRTLSIRNIFGGPAGRISESITGILFEGQEIRTVETYVYTAAGELSLIRNSIDLGGFRIPQSEQSFEYAGSLPVSATYSSYPNPFDLSEKDPVSRIEYDWYANGKERRVRSLEWDLTHAAWRLTQQDTFAYDAETRLNMQIREFVEGDTTIRERYTYTYLAGGEPDTESTWRWSAVQADWVLDLRKIWHYPEFTSGVGRPQGLLGLHPNPADGWVHTDLPGVSQVQVFDAAGRQMLAQRLQPGQPIDLGPLPAGIYHVMAQDAQGIRTARLVRR
ncbi:MAG: T9SS type A sorting domain-containing protein [Bacteroidia bacterium]|nr:T9SS type A sorting domain-containing protein [Bacteroidia bacterium]